MGVSLKHRRLDLFWRSAWIAVILQQRRQWLIYIVEIKSIKNIYVIVLDLYVTNFYFQEWKYSNDYLYFFTFFLRSFIFYTFLHFFKEKIVFFCIYFSFSPPPPTPLFLFLIHSFFFSFRLICFTLCSILYF